MFFLWSVVYVMSVAVCSVLGVCLAWGDLLGMDGLSRTTCGTLSNGYTHTHIWKNSSSIHTHSKRCEVVTFSIFLLSVLGLVNSSLRKVRVQLIQSITKWSISVISCWCKILTPFTFNWCFEVSWWNLRLHQTDTSCIYAWCTSEAFIM